MLASLVLTVVLFASSVSFGSCQATESEQQALSCMLKDNRTAQANFFRSIKAKNGVSNGILRTLGATKGNSVGLQCFSQRHCPGTRATWCFNMYHPTRLIEICWDSDNRALHSSEDATLLGLSGHFKTGYGCSGSPGPCIAVHLTPLYFDGGILTCTSQNETCTAKSFAKVDVSFSATITRYPEIIFHNTTNEMVIGQQNVYFFTAEIPNANYLLFSGFRYGTSPIGMYTYENQTRHKLDSIPEYPFCDVTGCQDIFRAPATYDKLKQQRVRVYSYSSFVPNCPNDFFLFNTWLVIDNARESDADIDYIYRVSVPVQFFPPREAIEEKIINLTAVAPIVNFTTLEVPSESNDSSLTADGNSTLVFEWGDSVEWRVSAQAGVEDRLVWMLDGQELVAVAAAGQNHNMDLLCSQYNGTYYIYGTQEVSRFVSNFTSSLFLCNFAQLHVGHYECSVVHSWGNQGPNTVWSTVAHISQQQPNTSQAAVPEQSLTTTDHRVIVEEEPVGPFFVLYIAVGVFIAVLLVAVLLMLVCMVLCIRRAQHARLYKNRRPSQRSDVVVQSFTNRAQIDSRRNSQHSSAVDELEFPREKLVILDKVLGNGTFGVVLLAKAEGIVRHSPDRNIVAIKTHKPSAPSDETDCLWQELQIMRSIKPHPNLVNLLGYTRETASSPLYLIMEFALHGSLQMFLQECEKVVLRLNHVPRVIARDGGRYTSCSSDTDSSTYTNMRKLSNSSQTEPPSSPDTTSSASVSFAADTSMPSEWSARAVSLQQNAGDDIFDSEISMRSCFVDETPAVVSHDYVNSKGLLCMEDVYVFAMQIASGLQHLEQQNIVHCDLAARNILISERFVLKIGDFGMAKRMSEKEYYRRSEGRIPVKWTAPEALEEHIFSHKSDIWSYAVILWEIFSYGRRPYADAKIGHSWEPFIRSLKAGTRLPQPDGCPGPFYELMECCWQLDPVTRPSASDLVRLFESSCSDLRNGGMDSVADMENGQNLSTHSLHQLQDTTPEYYDKEHKHHTS